MSNEPRHSLPDPQNEENSLLFVLSRYIGIWLTIARTVCKTVRNLSKDRSNIRNAIFALRTLDRTSRSICTIQRCRFAALLASLAAPFLDKQVPASHAHSGHPDAPVHRPRSARPNAQPSSAQPASPSTASLAPSSPPETRKPRKSKPKPLPQEALFLLASQLSRRILARCKEQRRRLECIASQHSIGSAQIYPQDYPLSAEHPDLACSTDDARLIDSLISSPDSHTQSADPQPASLPLLSPAATVSTSPTHRSYRLLQLLNPMRESTEETPHSFVEKYLAQTAARAPA